MSERRDITVQVNQQSYSRTIDPRTTLADFLRHELKLTGTHVGCEHGVCGACTVIVDGVSARSCLMLAVQTDGAAVETIEGLCTDRNLGPLQQAFRNQHGLQCGFCTPGILMTLTEFLRDVPAPTEHDIREVLSGNLCRCTGYQAIVDATLEAASVMRQQSEGATR